MSSYCWGGTPDYSLFLDSAWGPQTDDADFPLMVAQFASNFVYGTNPAYSVQDFFAIYPSFGGVTLTAPSGVATLGSPTLTGLANTTGIAKGNPIIDSAGLFPDGTYVL